MMVQVGMKYAASSAPLNELIRQFVDIVASRNFRVRPVGSPLCGEVTPLNCERQCKPFVYLNAAVRRSARKDEGKVPSFGGTLPLFPSICVARTSVPGRDFASAGQVSAGRHPAAGRASGPGSASADPDSGWGCSFGSSLVEPS